MYNTHIIAHSISWPAMPRHARRRPSCTGRFVGARTRTAAQGACVIPLICFYPEPLTP